MSYGRVGYYLKVSLMGFTILDAGTNNLAQMIDKAVKSLKSLYVEEGV